MKGGHAVGTDHATRAAWAAFLALVVAVLPSYWSPLLPEPLSGVAAWSSLVLPALLTGLALFSGLSIPLSGRPLGLRLWATLATYLVIGLGAAGIATLTVGISRPFVVLFLFAWPTLSLWFGLCYSTIWCPFGG